jgi:hypothetical protein
VNSRADIEADSPDIQPFRVADLLEMLALATAVAGLLYFGYFLLAPWIWSQNLPYNPADIASWILPELEDEGQDGVELYALYGLMFLDLLFVYALARLWRKLSEGYLRYLLVLPVAVSCAFIASIGFHPPMSTIADDAASVIFAHSFTVLIAVLPIIVALCYLQKNSVRWALVAVGLLLIPVCFISTAPISWIDYAYILAPALRLFHGAGVSEVYFQYDLLLSLIGLTWMKLQLDLNLFQVVGQCSYYLLLLALYALSRKWFLDKRLPVFLLAALVLLRIYGIDPYDITQLFQVTPLRLDLWLVLLALVYFKGPSHWSAGLYCGLLLVLHKNFGIIYSAAYVQLLLTLCIIETVITPGKLVESASSAAVVFIKRNYPTLALMLMGALAHYLLFMSPDAHSDFDYVRLGIGFIKIAAESFYWYVVVVSGLTFALLIRLRNKVSANYLATALFLIYLVIGNSLYFFGRSHENNIVGISIILLLLFFLLLDLVGYALGNARDKPAKQFIHRHLTMIVSVALIVAISVWYGGSITAKVATQASNIGKGQFIYPPIVAERNVMRTIAEIKSVTGNNPKVYFVDDNDFLLNYYGGYTPVGYYNPVKAWVFKPALSYFLQGLVDQGYYVVVNIGIDGVLPSIKYSNYRSVGKRWVVWK